MIRNDVSVKNELRDIIIADLALSVAFTLILQPLNGLPKGALGLLYTFPIALLATTLVFVLHEYMHKIVAQRFGAIAGFVKSDTGLLITLVSSLFGFLIGIPGATVIFSSNFTKREEGIVSLAGPAVNFAVFIIAFLIANLFAPFLSVNSYIADAVNTIMFISIILAFYNMLPIYPLDGSKVLKWNKLVYATTMIVIFVMLLQVIPLIDILVGFVLMLVIALFVSFFMRNVRLF